MNTLEEKSTRALLENHPRVKKTFPSAVGGKPSGEIKIEAFLPHFRDQEEQFSCPDTSAAAAKISVRGLNFFYGAYQALFDNCLTIVPGKLTALIGPSGAGKSTHLRVYNRIFELYRDQTAMGEVLFEGNDIFATNVDLLELRRRMAMIFSQPTPFPLSVFENIAYGLKLHYSISRAELHDRVEDALKKTASWDEFQEKLRVPALSLSRGEQQRLCLARTLALEPEVLLLDDPTAAIDARSARKIEEALETLKEKLTIVMATQNMQQAARVSDFTAFFSQGYIVEYGRTKQIFTNPTKKQTENYLTGRFG